MTDIDWDLLTLPPEEYARREMKRQEEDALIEKYVTKGDAWRLRRRIQEAYVTIENKIILEAIDPWWGKPRDRHFQEMYRDGLLKMAMKRKEMEEKWFKDE